jgi:lysophospholipase L1-like esterase
MGTELATLADAAASVPAAYADGDGSLIVLVHAGHNDAQLRGGEPRVDTERFEAAADRLDRSLAANSAVADHAVVGLVPLLRVAGGVPVADCQPDRSLDYDDRLARRVVTHLPVARPVDAWADRTEDGVHPNEAGHDHVARQVADWLSGLRETG